LLATLRRSLQADPRRLVARQTRATSLKLKLTLSALMIPEQLLTLVWPPGLHQLPALKPLSPSDLDLRVRLRLKVFHHGPLLLMLILIWGFSNVDLDVVDLNYGQGQSSFLCYRPATNWLTTTLADGQEGSSSPPFPRNMTYNGQARGQSHDNEPQVHLGNGIFATPVHRGSPMATHRPGFPVTRSMGSNGGKDFRGHQAETLLSRHRTIGTREPYKPTTTLQAIPAYRPPDGPLPYRDLGEGALGRMINQERRNVSAVSQAPPISSHRDGLPGDTPGGLLPPTQLLSQECQKRGFNPIFRQTEHHRGRGKVDISCNVELRDTVIMSDKLFGSAQAARCNVAKMALAVIRAWPLSRSGNFTRRKLTGFKADLDTAVDAEAARQLHTKLEVILSGRRFVLWRHRSNASVGPRLYIPDGWTGHNITVKLNDKWSIDFREFDLKAECRGCQESGSHPHHSRDKCPHWVEVKSHRGRRHGSGNGSNANSVEVRPRSRPAIKEEAMPDAPSGKAGASVAPAAQASGDRHSELVHNIQELVGTAAMSADSQDPNVKTAFLEGVALGARLAATAPGLANIRSRSRSRSPRRQDSLSDHWGPGGDRHPLHPHTDRYTPTYRQRSPLRENMRSSNATLRDAEGAREGSSKAPTSAPRGPAQAPVHPRSFDFPRRPGVF
jgi:hypothetical protein